MNWGLTKFQNDYILAGEAFDTKTRIPLVLDETKLVMQLLSWFVIQGLFGIKANLATNFNVVQAPACLTIIQIMYGPCNASCFYFSTSSTTISPVQLCITYS